MSGPRRPRHPLPGDPPAYVADSGLPDLPAAVSSSPASPRSVPAPSGPSGPGLLAAQSHLTSRDLTIADWLDRHGVLTTAQLTAAFFTSPITAAHRLAKLRAIGLVDRFHRPMPTGGFGPWHWVIGPLGAQITAAARDTTEPTPRALRTRHAKLVDSAKLPHLLGTNQFFIDLHAHARHHEDTALVRWWSEHDTTLRYRTRIHPDGHALWRQDNIVMGLFLEYDRSTEDLERLVRKLTAYDQLAADGGPAYPVLFWLHSAQREDNLHAALAQRRRVGPVPVATAVRGNGHGPAGPVWTLAGGRGRRTLGELPYDHGDPDSMYNPNLHDPDLDQQL